MKLSICIATKNRPAKLALAIQAIIKSFENLTINEERIYLHNFEICIADSSENNLTKEVIEKITEQYIDLHINYKYFPAQGIDIGYERAVYLSKGEYIWLLSDDEIIYESAFLSINNLLKDIDKNNHIFILNGSLKDKYNKFTLKEHRFDDLTQTNFIWRYTSLEDKLKLFGYMCLISCVLFKREIWFSSNLDKKWEIKNKFFSHITRLMSGLDNNSIIKIIPENFFVITQGPQSWLNNYSKVYDSAFNDCLSKICFHGKEMQKVHINKNKKISYFLRSFIYSSSKNNFLRKFIAFLIGISLYLIEKFVPHKNNFKLLSYEFLSFSNEILPLILWRKYYSIVLFDARHSHRLTGIGKFQNNLLKFLEKFSPRDKIFVTTKRYRKNRTKNFDPKNQIGINVLCSNYIISEIIQIPILIFFIRPEVIILTANTAPFLIPYKSKIRLFRVVHDTIFIDNVKDFLKKYKFNFYFFRKFLTEIYLTLNLLITSKNEKIENICISKYSKKSAEKHNIKTSNILLPSYFGQNKTNTINKKVFTNEIILFIADDPRKNSLKTIQAFIEYLKDSPQSKCRINTMNLVGNINNINLKKMISCLVKDAPNFGGEIIYHGRISEDDLNNLFKKTTYLLYPSSNEGFGLPVCEAWINLNIPIVSNNGSLNSFPDSSLIRIKKCDIFNIKEALFLSEKLDDRMKQNILQIGIKQIEKIEKQQFLFLEHVFKKCS